MSQCVRNGTIPAGALAEHASAPVAAAFEALLDRRQHFVQQEVFPRAHRSRVDILIAAKPGEAIGKGHDNRRHAIFADQPIEPLRQVLPEPNPVGLSQPAAGKADQVHEQRQSSSVMPCRNVYIHITRRWVTKHIALERRALNGNAADGSRRPSELAHTCNPLASSGILGGVHPWPVPAVQRSVVISHSAGRCVAVRMASKCRRPHHFTRQRAEPLTLCGL